MTFRPNRRALLVGAASGFLAAPAFAATNDLRTAAYNMALYGLPLIEMATTRTRAFTNGLVANRFRHSTELINLQTQRVTGPNNDTLYSTAWLDLSQGPVKLVLPATGERYFSLTLMDMFTNNFTVLGSRTTGPDGGEFWVVGPQSPAMPGVIRAPTPWVWALARTLQKGQEDLPNVHALQAGLRVEGPGDRKPKTYALRTAAWQDYFTAVQDLILEAGTPATDTRLFRENAALGIRPTGGFDPGRFSEAQGREIAAGLAQALEIAKQGDRSALNVGGWLMPRADLGVWGEDYVYRAQIALSGLAALPLAETLYMHAAGPDGRGSVDSRRGWKLSLPAGGIPVDAFWSFTAYALTPDDQAFLFANPINRSSIGDRTPGLVRGPKGELDIFISPTDPGPSRRANWLPAPSDGTPMRLTLRAYRPRPELLSGAFRVPALRPL